MSNFPKIALLFFIFHAVIAQGSIKTTIVNNSFPYEQAVSDNFATKAILLINSTGVPLFSSQVPHNIFGTTTGILESTLLEGNVETIIAKILYVDEYDEGMSSGIRCSFQGVKNCNNGIHVFLEEDSCSISCTVSN